MGLRAGLDWCGKSRPHRDSIPGPSSPLAVAIPTELPGPKVHFYKVVNSSIKSETVLHTEEVFHDAELLLCRNGQNNYQLWTNHPRAI